MKKTILVAACSFASAANSANNSNNSPQVGFFDSQDTYDRLKNEAPDGSIGEPTSFTIDDEVTNDLTVWDRDDVQQLVQEHNLTEV